MDYFLHTRFARASGMVAVCFYAVHVVLGGWLWSGYSHLQQPISDLTATGAPDRKVLLVFTNLYGFLALIFALTLVQYASRLGTWGRAGAVSLVGLHLLSLAYGFFPEDLPGSPATWAGRMHIWTTAATVLLTLAAPLLLGVRSRAGQQELAQISRAAFAALLVLGTLTAYLFAYRLPYFGLAERLNIAVLQGWTFWLSYRITTRP